VVGTGSNSTGSVVVDAAGIVLLAQPTAISGNTISITAIDPALGMFAPPIWETTVTVPVRPPLSLRLMLGSSGNLVLSAVGLNGGMVYQFSAPVIPKASLGAQGPSRGPTQPPPHVKTGLKKCAPNAPNHWLYPIELASELQLS